MTNFDHGQANGAVVLADNPDGSIFFDQAFGNGRSPFRQPLRIHKDQLNRAAHDAAGGVNLVNR